MHRSNEQLNKQTKWPIPTKYKLQWKIDDVQNFREIMSPQIFSSCDTKFTIFLTSQDNEENIKVCMKSTSAKAKFMIKGVISVNNGEYVAFNSEIKKGSDEINLLNHIPVQPSATSVTNTLEISVKFITYPIMSQYLRIDKNAAKFGESLKDFMEEKSESTSLTDCSLLLKSTNKFCHKALLCARSAKLNLFFENLPPNAEDVSFPYDNTGNYTDIVVEGLLNYLYSGNPYKLIEKHAFNDLKHIKELGRKLEIPEIGNLFEKMNFSVDTKSHSCFTEFNIFITNKELSILKDSEPGFYEFPNIAFCNSKWKMECIKKEPTRGDEKKSFRIVLKKMGKENITNVEVYISYLNSVNEWVELQKIKESITSTEQENVESGSGQIKNNKKRKLSEDKSYNKNAVFEFLIDDIDEWFASISCIKTENIEKLILKCKIEHKKFYDSVDLKVKNLSASRFLYERLHFGSLLVDLNKMYENKSYTDLKLRLSSPENNSQKEFEVHKIILAARSPIFKQKINESENNEIEIEVGQTLFDNFDEIIHYLYTSKIDFNTSTIPPLDAYEYGFRSSIIDLKSTARKDFTASFLCSNNADNAMHLAIDCKDDPFKDDLKKYMNQKHSQKWNPLYNKFTAKTNETKNSDNSDISDQVINGDNSDQGIDFNKSNNGEFNNRSNSGSSDDEDDYH